MPPPTDASQRITVVNVLAVSYTGSTWVNLMLGAHPEVFSVGEVDRIRKMGRAVCTIHGPDCPLWSRYQPEGGENPFVQMAALSGRRVLVVNNSRMYAEELKDPRIDRCDVMIFRDGRAFVASALRREPGKVVRHTLTWMRDTQRRYRWLKRDRGARSQLMHYEKLQRDPEPALREVCNAIGITYDPAMLDYTNAQPHFISGNPGPLSVVARKHGIGQLHALMRDRQVHLIDLSRPKHTLPDGQGVEREIDLSAYLSPRGEAGHDERWTKQLTPGQLRKFQLVGGWLNHLLGYPPAMTRSSFPLRK